MEAKVGESEKALEAREASLRQLEANYEARLYQGEKRIRDEVRAVDFDTSALGVYSRKKAMKISETKKGAFQG